MTHQPPVPAASTTPYPLHPTPVAEHAGQQEMGADKDAASPDKTPALLGIAAAVAAGSAAVAALLLARRRSAARDTAGGGRSKAGHDRASDRTRVAGGQPY